MKEARLKRPEFDIVTIGNVSLETGSILLNQYQYLMVCLPKINGESQSCKIPRQDIVKLRNFLNEILERRID